MATLSFSFVSHLYYPVQTLNCPVTFIGMLCTSFFQNQVTVIFLKTLDSIYILCLLIEITIKLS